MTIRATAIEREALDTRSSGDSRKRVDAYFVAYDCPADEHNSGRHEWMCRFEVARGTAFKMQDFPSKKEAIAARGFTI